jgi:hypothetical protein
MQLLNARNHKNKYQRDRERETGDGFCEEKSHVKQAYMQ